MIAAGFGMREGAGAGDILALLDEALARAGLARADLARLASVAARASEPGLREAGSRLGLPVASFQSAALAAVADRIVSHSPRVQALYGIGCVAEAAALAGAGENARLLLPRIASDKVTCALAQGHGAGEEP